MNTPLVSVVMTAYNVQDTIREAVASVQRQNYPNLELIIIDDCSTDETPNIIKELAEDSHGMITVSSNLMNEGAGMSRYLGSNLCTGQFVMFMDSDDVISSDYITCLMREFRDDIDIVSGGLTIDYENGDRQIYFYGHGQYSGMDAVRRLWPGERIPSMNNKIIRRHLLQQVPYCTRRFIEDTPTIMPMMYLARAVKYVENAGYMYRQRSQSLCHSSSELKFAIYRALCYIDLIEFFTDKGEKSILPELNQDLSVMMQQIRDAKPTPETVNPHASAWIELSTRIFKYMK